MALWIADSERALTRLKEDVQTLCAQGTCLTACGDSVICAAQDGAHVYTAAGEEIAAYPLPPGICRLCALPDALYALSSEADSVSLLCPRTGRLRLCARAGCYPRDMMLSRCGRYLLVSGGAAGETMVLLAQDLQQIGRYALPGVVCAAAFGERDMYALCAVEENDMAAHVLRISPRGVISQVQRMSALPGAMRVLTDGSLLCGVAGEMLRLRPDGRVLQRYPGGLAQSIRVVRDGALVADPVEGCVMQTTLSIGKSAGKIFLGASPSDVLVF